MSTSKIFHCVVDDTALTTNLEEIAQWVRAGLATLVVPLYTLERLHLLKKDASQLGQNARKAVKFLDQVTSTPNLSHDPVIIQGPDDEYLNWCDVESRYVESVILRDESELNGSAEPREAVEPSGRENEPEKLIRDLSLSSEDIKTSPVSTPPLSPSASDPQSTKTSPETQYATITKHEATPIPPTLKTLINFVVWYTYESNNKAQPKRSIFLTNSADAAQIAKDFGVKPKTIHQLRASIELEQPVKKEQQTSKKKKGGSRSMSFKHDSEPKTLFRYDEASSEDEELVFQPRSRDPPRPGSSGRGATNNNFRGRGAAHSPSNSITANTLPKPQVPVEEIDPDSFDRGTFARGSTPLANVGTSYGLSNHNVGRGGQRNISGPQQRGGFRGNGNGFRGRGRGRLFVP